MLLIDRTLTFVNCRIKFNQMAQSSFVRNHKAFFEIDYRFHLNKVLYLVLHLKTEVKP